ncbi:hypothetical protein AMTR_s00014p00090010 [Amborella trichopoda]|uniref:Uncharacterized protein n=2 Tax=Amborella trichopoda TaxID=13333 RepID=W1PM12_AMBTC|nr:hypothetical protein AMTR_s00014p00090010 [Amborella trichopoda]
MIRLLRACTSIRSLDRGMILHGHAIKAGLNSHTSIETTLVIMYVKCNSLLNASLVFDNMHQRNPIVNSAMIAGYSKHKRFEDAQKTFDGITERNIKCWNAMISAYSLNQNYHEGLALFRELQASRLDPDEFTVSNVLTISANLNALEEGKQIHGFIVKKGFVLDVTVSNSLINMYSKCACMDDAERVFEAITQRDVYSWTAMVSGYAQNGKTEAAMKLFNEMPQRNVVSWNAMIGGYQQEGDNISALAKFVKMLKEREKPNQSSFVSVLKACAGLQTIETGKQIQSYLIKSGTEADAHVGTAIIEMHAKFGDIISAHKSFEASEHNVVSWSVLVGAYTQNGYITEAASLFQEMPKKNVISYNIMVSAYVQNELKTEAFSLLSDMIKAGVRPNEHTLSSLLNSCSGKNKTGFGLHGFAIKMGFEVDISIGNCLVTMYGEQRCMNNAYMVFQSMPRHDVVSWTAMVSAYLTNQRIEEARQTFESMPQQNLISWNTMISGYLQAGKITVDPMSETSITVTYTKDPLSGAEDALTLFYKMEQSGIRPDNFTYNCALTACAAIGALHQASTIHAITIHRAYDSDKGVTNALMAAYSKCGSLQNAEQIFNNLEEPDTISWNTLITGYAQNGQGNHVLEFFNEMLKSGIEPNHVTYVSILSACSYIGEVEKGREYFESMSRDHGLNPRRDHYACMVDLLGRAGHLKDAMTLIKDMPFEPDSVVWGALLGACQLHSDPELGRQAAEKILELNPDSSGTYATLSNIFAGAGMWEDAARVRTAMKGQQLQKKPGCSWIEIRGYKQLFLAGDRSHPQRDSILAALSDLYINIKEEGYAPELGFCVIDMDSDEYLTY